MRKSTKSTPVMVAGACCLFLVAAVAFDRYHAKHRRQPVNNAGPPKEEPVPVRDAVGDAHGYRMLVAFAGDRDYKEALRLARLINERHPGSRYHNYAKRLAEQLPQRKDDFTKLKLPTPAEWSALKTKLTRAQQIDFLCERMRLLNCGPDGWGDPLDQTQFAEPIYASHSLQKGKTKVINPLTELVGPSNWSGEEKTRPKGMELTLKDIPHLSKHLRPDWFMVTVFISHFGKGAIRKRHVHAAVGLTEHL